MVVDNVIPPRMFPSHPPIHHVTLLGILSTCDSSSDVNSKGWGIFISLEWSVSNSEGTQTSLPWGSTLGHKINFSVPLQHPAEATLSRAYPRSPLCMTYTPSLSCLFLQVLLSPKMLPQTCVCLKVCLCGT